MGTMTVTRDVPLKGVMFDFSGTLLRVGPVSRWLPGALAGSGRSLPPEESARYARRLEEVGALPGLPPLSVPADLEPLLAVRDLGPEEHVAAYSALARRAALPWEDAEELYRRLYAWHMTPDAWRPYPDAAEVLGGLRERGVRVAVVSNIGWDLRPVLRAHGLDEFVDAYVLSFEHRVQKPEPRLFEIACAELGLPPGRVGMVGDERGADGGAAALGCPVAFVDHLPVGERPDGLRRAVAELLDAVPGRTAATGSPS
jgi:putative hydrolase of the HAD superfamily